jgi:hypothetical protein
MSNLQEIERLFNELKGRSKEDDSTRTHEIYLELARLAEVPKLGESTESEWKSLSPYEWNAIQMRPTMPIEQIAEELSKDSPLEINSFEVELYLNDAHERIEYYVQSLLSDNQKANEETKAIADGGLY